MKSKLLVSVVLGAMLVGFSGCANNEESAKKAYEEKNYNEAVKLLDQEEEKSKEAAEVYSLSKAQLAVKEESYSDALKFIEDLDSDQAKELAQKCHYNIALNELSNKVANNNVQETYESFTEAQEVLSEANQAKLNETMSELLQDKVTEQNLDSFYYAEGLASILRENGSANSNWLADSLEKDLDENAETKMKLFLMSTMWVRNDDTDLSGTKLKIQFNDSDGFATIEESTDFGKSYGYEKGDIKWKNIQFVDPNTFRYEELGKGQGQTIYFEGIGQIDYSEKKINNHISSDLNTTGRDQILVPVQAE